jgi:hypothetical protein
MFFRIASTESTSRLIRTRVIYFITAVGIAMAGLASRTYREQLPTFLAEYAGDTLWALMVFLLVSTLLVKRTIVLRAALALALAFLVEISQLYHAPWIDSIRHTTPGRLVLGFGFLWSDLVCYSIGVGLGAITEWTVASTIRKKM